MLISCRSLSTNIRVSFVKSIAHCVSDFQSSLPSSSSCAMSGSRKTMSPKNAVFSRIVDNAGKHNTNYNRTLVWELIRVITTTLVTRANKSGQHGTRGVVTNHNYA